MLSQNSVVEVAYLPGTFATSTSSFAIRLLKSGPSNSHPNSIT